MNDDKHDAFTELLRSYDRSSHTAQLAMIYENVVGGGDVWDDSTSPFESARSILAYRLGCAETQDDAARILLALASASYARPL